jgi:thymidylate synthase
MNCELNCELNLIVAYDNKFGIGKNNGIPWKVKEDMKHFQEKTRDTTIVMGYNTWLSIGRKLTRRVNVVISRTYEEDNEKVEEKDRKELIFVSSLDTYLGNLKKEKESKEKRKIFIVGGEKIYREFLMKYTPENIYLTEIDVECDCDTFFPCNLINLGSYKETSNEILTQDGIKVKFKHLVWFQNKDERTLLNLYSHVLNNGELKEDRTGIGTHSIFGAMLKFNLYPNVLPLMTSKFVGIKTVIRELLWMLSGSTDSKKLEEQGVKIWKKNGELSFLRSQGLPYREGDLGPIYGFQWRHFGAKYRGADADYTGEGVDQIQRLIRGIIEKPQSRRHILCSWNVEQIDEMALPPCHVLFQLTVSGDGKFLSARLDQRSADMFLGLPFNIASYAILTHLIAKLTGLQAKELTIQLGDVHIYRNHEEQVKTLLGREVYAFPRIEIEDIDDIDKVGLKHFKIFNYKHGEKIEAEMAV